MGDTAPQHQPRLLVSQKLARTINRYTVTTALQDGAPAQTVAFAEQSRFTVDSRSCRWAAVGGA